MRRNFKVEVASKHIDGAYFVTFIELEGSANPARVEEYLQTSVYPDSFVDLEEVNDAS